MTPEESKQFALTGKYTCKQPIHFTTQPAQVAPDPKDDMAHVAQPLPAKPEDYNHLSVSEMEHFHELKGMDPLHQSDKVAKEFHRGSRCREYLQEKGAAAFKSHYFKD